jgi:pantetheine-phosphate adenylyltransferase
MKRALIAGTFDPITNGHVEVINTALDIFDEVVVAIGVNPDKKPMFSIEERKEMINSIFGSVDVVSFEGKFQIDFALEMGCQFIIRGIRNQNDFEYEKTIRNINSDMRGEVVRMVYLIPRRKNAEISSSMVKGLIGPRGWEDVVEKYVPQIVLEKLEEKCLR